MENILLQGIDTLDLGNIDVYIDNGGYKALDKALKMKPEDVIGEIKTSKLLGRGGAAFPAGLKWEFTRKAEGSRKFLICNADEGEPGTFKDKILLKKNPHALIEAMAIAGYAIGTSESYIYIRGSYVEEIATLKKAIKDAHDKGKLGENILETGFSFDIKMYCGAGSYVCGSETALFESMLGKRGAPLRKPPFPTQSGYMGLPTVINNVETLCNVPHIINNGAEWYSKIGTAESTGTKLYCVSGHVNKPGVYEIPLGITLRDLVDKYAGGVKGTFKAAFPGGVSSSLVTDLDIKLDYQSLMAAGTMLGSGAIIVMNDTTDIVALAENCMKFFNHESCGKCTSCREGTRQAGHILRKISDGKARPVDLELLTELSAVLPDASRCALGRAALNVVTSGMKYFGPEFERGVRG